MEGQLILGVVSLLVSAVTGIGAWLASTQARATSAETRAAVAELEARLIGLLRNEYVTQNDCKEYRRARLCLVRLKDAHAAD